MQRLIVLLAIAIFAMPNLAAAKSPKAEHHRSADQEVQGIDGDLGLSLIASHDINVQGLNDTLQGAAPSITLP